MDTKTETAIMELKPETLPPAIREKNIFLPLIKSLAASDHLGAKLALQPLYDKSSDRLELSKNVLKDGVNLPEVVKVIGIPATMSVVALMVQRFCQQFNVSKNMSASQVEDFAADLVLEFNNRKGNQVRLEELAIFFDRAGKGEFTRKDGRPFIFDRIDRGVLEEMMDHYFTNDRTAAVWAIEDEKEAAKRNQLGGDEVAQIFPRSSPATVFDKDGNEITPKNIYDLAGTGSRFAIAKTLKELGEKYGGE